MLTVCLTDTDSLVLSRISQLKTGHVGPEKCDSRWILDVGPFITLMSSPRLRGHEYWSAGLCPRLLFAVTDDTLSVRG